jgi:hypothetical protein
LFIISKCVNKESIHVILNICVNTIKIADYLDVTFGVDNEIKVLAKELFELTELPEI